MSTLTRCQGGVNPHAYTLETITIITTVYQLRCHVLAITLAVFRLYLNTHKGLVVPMCDRVLFFRQSGRRRFMQSVELFITQDDSMGIHSPSTRCDCVLSPRHQGRRRFMQNTKLFIHQQDDSMEIHLRLK